LGKIPYNGCVVKFITDIGFCSGVTSAVRKREEEGKGKKIFLAHPLRHNKEENERLRKERDASFLPKDILSFSFGKDSLLVFSAHGAPKPEREKAEKRGIPFLLTTCPIILSRLKERKEAYHGEILFYAGKKDHPETLSFLSEWKKAFYLNPDNDFSLPSSLKEGKGKPALLFTQSTLGEKETDRAKKKISSNGYSLDYVSPSCPVFSSRLHRALAFLKGKEKENFSFAVLGDKTSSNARALFSARKERFPSHKGYFLSSPKDVEKEKRSFQDLYLLSSTSLSRGAARKIYSKLLELA